MHPDLSCELFGNALSVVSMSRGSAAGFGDRNPQRSK